MRRDAESGEPLLDAGTGEPVLARVHCSLNINTETGRLSARRPNLQNQPALEKDRYKVRCRGALCLTPCSCMVLEYGSEVRLQTAHVWSPGKAGCALSH